MTLDELQAVMDEIEEKRLIVVFHPDERSSLPAELERLLFGCRIVTSSACPPGKAFVVDPTKLPEVTW